MRQRRANILSEPKVCERSHERDDYPITKSKLQPIKFKLQRAQPNREISPVNTTSKYLWHGFLLSLLNVGCFCATYRFGMKNLAKIQIK